MIGKRIQAVRKNRGFTQAQVAERMHVTEQAVSQWETDKTQPDIDRIPELAQTLGTTPNALLGMEETWPDSPRQDKAFSPERTYSRLKSLAEAEGLTETRRALAYAREKHAGQYRMPPCGTSVRIPYILHPLMMTAVAHAMGIREDAVLAAAMLHDVCEDCGVLPSELPFSQTVRDAVCRLTKDKDAFDKNEEAAEHAYLEGLRENRIALFVKCLDRNHNLSTMAASFPPDRLRKYVRETEDDIMPLLDELDAMCPDLRDPAFLLRQQMQAILETVKAMLPQP